MPRKTRYLLELDEKGEPYLIYRQNKRKGELWIYWYDFSTPDLGFYACCKGTLEKEAKDYITLDRDHTSLYITKKQLLLLFL